MNEVRLRVRAVNPIDLETAVGDLAQDGARFDSTLGNFDPVTGTLIIAGLTVGGKIVIRLWREFKGGTVIDLTRLPIEISRNKALDYGYLMIIAKDGSVTVEAKDEPEDALERIVKEALSLGENALVEDLQTIIKGACGGSAPVQLTPA